MRFFRFFSLFMKPINRMNGIACAWMRRCYCCALGLQVIFRFYLSHSTHLRFAQNLFDVVQWMGMGISACESLLFFCWIFSFLPKQQIGLPSYRPTGQLASQPAGAADQWKKPDGRNDLMGTLNRLLAMKPVADCILFHFVLMDKLANGLEAVLCAGKCTAKTSTKSLISMIHVNCVLHYIDYRADYYTAKTEHTAHQHQQRAQRHTFGKSINWKHLPHSNECVNANERCYDSSQSKWIHTNVFVWVCAFGVRVQVMHRDIIDAHSLIVLFYWIYISPERNCE